MANNPASFFIYFPILPNDAIEDIAFENMKTMEKLVLKKMDNGDEKLLIARYPLNAAKSWIEANENEIYKLDNAKLERKICMNNDLAMLAEDYFTLNRIY
jgi:hypothetical protein